MFSCHNHCLKSLKMLSNQQYQQKTHITTIRSTHRVPNRSTHRDSPRCFATQTYSPRPYRTPSDGHIRPRGELWEGLFRRFMNLYTVVTLWKPTPPPTTPLLEATFRIEGIFVVKKGGNRDGFSPDHPFTFRIPYEPKASPQFLHGESSPNRSKSNSRKTYRYKLAFVKHCLNTIETY